MIANNDVKQLIIPECYIGVYHNGGINANGRISMFTGSQDYVKIVGTKIKKNLAYVIFPVLILTRYRSRTLVRISLHQQLHPKSHYTFDIPDVLQGSIIEFTFCNHILNNFLILHLVWI